MHAVILALMFTSGPPGVSFEHQPPTDYSAVLSADAAKLAGKWVQLRVELDSLPEARDGFVVFDCTSADSTHRTVWFAQGETGGDDADVRIGDAAGRVEVVGRLAIVQHPGRRIGAPSVPPFTELRLLDARRVK